MGLSYRDTFCRISVSMRLKNMDHIFQIFRMVIYLRLHDFHVLCRPSHAGYHVLETVHAGVQLMGLRELDKI